MVRTLGLAFICQKGCMIFECGLQDIVALAHVGKEFPIDVAVISRLLRMARIPFKPRGDGSATFLRVQLPLCCESHIIA